MWNEFHSNPNDLGPESEQLLHNLFTTDNDREVDFLERDEIKLEPSITVTKPSGPTEAMASVRVRRGQQYFRQTVLNSYGIRCCISGINVPRLLVASHIKPWRDFPDERLDPRNGLCLSSLHDAAFDAGLITLDEKFRVVLSRRLRSFLPQTTLEQNFIPFDGKRIRSPEKLVEPSGEFVSYHRRVIFVG